MIKLTLQKSPLDLKYIVITIGDKLDSYLMSHTLVIDIYRNTNRTC